MIEATAPRRILRLVMPVGIEMEEQCTGAALLLLVAVIIGITTIQNLVEMAVALVATGIIRDRMMETNRELKSFLIQAPPRLLKAILRVVSLRNRFSEELLPHHLLDLLHRILQSVHEP